MPKPSKRRVRRQLFLIKQAIDLVLGQKLTSLTNDEERELARQAYFNLCTLYNSLHRYLVET